MLKIVLFALGILAVTLVGGVVIIAGLQKRHDRLRAAIFEDSPDEYGV